MTDAHSGCGKVGGLNLLFLFKNIVWVDYTLYIPLGCSFLARLMPKYEYIAGPVMGVEFTPFLAWASITSLFMTKDGHIPK